MKRDYVILYYPFIKVRLIQAYTERMTVEGIAIFLFFSVHCLKSYSFSLFLSDEIRAEKLIIHVQAMAQGATTIFLESDKKGCSDIEINLYATKDALLYFTFFIHSLYFLKKRILAHLNTAHSKIFVRGNYLAPHYSSITIDTYQYHSVRSCESDVQINGISADFATVRHNGYIGILKKAHDVKTHQTSKHITLSKSAKIYACPVLDVAENAVNCSHGSAIGYIEKENLFYLYARGIDKKTAITLFLTPFITKETEKSSVRQALAVMIRTLQRNVYE